tara:strand:+ start:376 stop:825 length:450 start_codon:yes stop_codon:yes gene_type:complete
LVLVVAVVVEYPVMDWVEMELMEEIPPLEVLELLILVNQITPLLKAVAVAVAAVPVVLVVVTMVELVVPVVEEDLVVKMVKDQQLNQELIHLPLSLTMEMMEVQGHHRLVPLLEGEVLVALGQVLMLLQEIHLDLVVMGNHFLSLHLHI